MNVYDFARNFEEEKANFYADLITKTQNAGLKNILKMLNQEEKNHALLVDQLRNNETHMECAETEILSDAKEEFQKMQLNTIDAAAIAEELDLYKKALEMESESEKFYLDKSGGMEPGYTKDIFTRLAAEEAKHVRLMENLVEFVSRPETWIEDAEFYHMDEY